MTLQQLTNGAQTVFFQAGGEWCYLRTPASYTTAEQAIPCVIQCHGNRGYVRDGAADWLDEDPKRVFVQTLVQAGIAVAGSHATGNHWGRPSAVAATAALFEALLAQANVDKARMGLWGGGLGGAVLWNAATGPLVGRVRAAVLQQAVVSYKSVIFNHKFKDQLLEAYGMPADAPDDLAVATLAQNDPLQRTWHLVLERGAMTRRLLPEVLFLHGDVDENTLYQEHPVALAEILKSCGASYTFQTYPGVGHATYDLGDRAARDMTGFFRQAFAL